jgi:PST family polysaccharide transporter
VTLAQIFANIAYYIDNVIVGRYLGSMAIGLYQMAFQIMDLPRRFFGSVVDQVSFVVMSKVQDDKERLRLGYLQSLNIANLILVPITAIMIITAPELVVVILGDNWTGAILPLQILLTQVPIRATVRAADQISTAVGKVYRLAQYKIIYMILIAVAAFIGIQWGLTGVAIMVTAAVLINWVLMVGFTIHIVNASIWDYLKTWSSAMIFGIVIALPTYFASVYIRQYIASELIRLVVLVGISFISCIILVYFWPKVIGVRNIRLVLDFGKKAAKLSKVFIWLEQKFFMVRLPELYS